VIGHNCLTLVWIVTYQKDMQNTTTDHKDMSQAKLKCWRFEVLKLVIIHVAVFWNVMSRDLIAI